MKSLICKTPHTDQVWNFPLGTAVGAQEVYDFGAFQLGGHLNCLLPSAEPGVETLLYHALSRGHQPAGVSSEQWAPAARLPQSGEWKSLSVHFLARQGQALHPPNPSPCDSVLEGNREMLHLRGYSHHDYYVIQALCPYLQESFKEETALFLGLICCLICSQASVFRRWEHTVRPGPMFSHAIWAHWLVRGEGCVSPEILSEAEEVMIMVI